ncbi:endonuclease domain-containing protein [Streptomyces sp. NBC_01386]|uniref:hypothetical protein n=1 Tax=Streptomyces sp. NBC_01386 TaxID=2903848 RepID=UPI00324667AF
MRPDFFFVRDGVVVEIEGYAFHGTREAHRRDVERFNDLQMCPEVRLILRFTAHEVFDDSARMVARIRHALSLPPQRPQLAHQKTPLPSKSRPLPPTNDLR